MKPAIAIVGMACRYPDAKSPSELWENVLAQRRAFRRIPPQRLRLEDYSHPDPNAPDKTYLTRAALIEDYQFDRVGFRVAGSSYRSADLVHWLALDVAAAALADAGLGGGEGIDREATGVILGNTLTGEFSRAGLMRLRWPYVRRVIDAGLADEGMPRERRSKLLAELEARYKKPFPPVGEESLAGGLSNTIAGRICNHFDFKGGGFTVDGACASSLLAVTNACAMLLSGDLDVALAGGVDLSLDPFELVGFAKTGALAPEEMRIYDERSAGFWPGEGCGFVTLMRREDAMAKDLPIVALVRGWGISSDGSGGITRPEIEGQRIALRRAYARAGFGIDTVGLFEGHGTGTSVGDATELKALTLSRRESGAAGPAAIGSIKANIGHTKAAAGVAGIIKAVMAVHHACLPPTTGCETPHAELRGDSPALRVLREAEDWPAKQPIRAAISAMGFGGINSHLVIESGDARACPTGGSDATGVAHGGTTPQVPSSPRWRALGRSAQDAEVFLFSAQDGDALRSLVARVADASPALSRAELVDLAAALARHDRPQAARAAVVARTPEQLHERLAQLLSGLGERDCRTIDADQGVFVGANETAAAPRIGFLFPGQGSPSHLGGGALRRRFPEARAIYEDARLPTAGDGVATQVAQPAIVTASAAAAATLQRLGVHACVAIGHSLGELTAYHWAGVYDAAALIRLAAARGAAMGSLGDATGAMAGVRAGAEEVRDLIADLPITIAGLNSPRQTVVSGEASAIDELVRRAAARGHTAVRLPVSHAFHSPLVAAAESALAEHLAGETFGPPKRAVVSTITGGPIEPGADLRASLRRQVTHPVRFEEAVARARGEADLWIEVGPGRVLSGLARECGLIDVVATDAGGASLAGLLAAIAAAHVCGATIDADALFADRVVRPFDLDRPKTFLANPCEEAPALDDEAAVVESATPEESREAPTRLPDGQAAVSLSPLELIRKLVAARAELPPETVGDDSRLLSDLHLNSISVGQIVADAARQLGAPVPVAPTEYADATVIGMARALEAQMRDGAAQPAIDPDSLPEGVDTWIRDFTMAWVERSPAPMPPHPAPARSWRIISPKDHQLAGRLQSALGGGEEPFPYGRGSVGASGAGSSSGDGTVS
jgi:enediyne polyketide synthase